MKLLKQGSKDTLVVPLKKILNHEGMLARKLIENDSFDGDTTQAIKHFQKRSGLKEDGIVGPKTAAALAKLIGPAAAPFAAAFGRSEATPGPHGAATAEKHHHLTVNGKNYVFTKAEFDVFNKGMVLTLKRTAVLAAAHRAEAARTCWNTFRDLNKDQYIVSWFVSALGPKLPDESLIKSAEQAYSLLRTAVDSGDFRRIEDQLAKCGLPINTAYQTMMSYQNRVIGRSQHIVSVLTFTRDASFDICAAIGKVVLGGAPGTGAVADGGAELLKSTATEFGKYIAGTSSGGSDALRTVIVDGLLGAATGAADDLMKLKGEKVVKGAAESIVKKLMSNKWAARVGIDRVRKLVIRALNGAMKGALECAIKNASKLIKKDMSLSAFFEQIAKDAAFDSFLDGLDEWMVSKQFAARVFEKSSTLSRLDLGKVTKAEAIKMLQEIIQDKGKDGVKSCLEFAIDRAKGNEKAEEVGNGVAEQFARSYVKSLEGEVAKRIKRR